VLLNSHLLSEVEISCDRVAFLKEGEVVETRKLNSALEEQTGVTIRATNVSPDAVAALQSLAGSVRMEGEHLILSVTSTSVLPQIVRCLVEKGAQVYEVTPQRLSLEERFLEIVGSDGGL
jgi:ABC-2 type transport system ATP-binding protein